MKERYVELLNKYSGNKEIIELLQECILDDIIIAENYYADTNKYPDKRDLLHKLISDLTMFREYNKGGNNGRE